MIPAGYIMKRIFSLCCFILIASTLVGAISFPVTAQEDEPLPLFINASESAGVVNNRLGTDKVIGQAWGDYDQDGWLDLYVTDPAGPNTLYRNEQDGTFSISAYTDSVALPNDYSTGVVFTDYNNDGWPDLYVLNWGPNTLFRNERGLGFVDVTTQAGVAGNENSQTASWGDYDQDGWLDLYVANWSCYPRCGRPSSGEMDRLYHNNGDGTFSDVSSLLGGKMAGAGFVASFIDYDNDGDLDIYLVNDEFIHPVGNALWRNDGPGCDGWCFSDVSEEAGANTKVMGMGLAIGDYNNDGYLDFYFSNAGPMTLLQNMGNGTFSDMATPAGVVQEGAIGWGTAFFDYDNDGWQDLYLAVAENSDGSPPADPLFHNEGDGTFENVSAISGLDTIPGRTLGVAYADYDNDGWVDLAVGHYDSGYEIYRNLGAEFSTSHWLGVELVGRGAINREGIGSRVYLTTKDGNTQSQLVTNGSSLGAGNMTRLHFGLGDAAIQELKIVWPDGTEQQFRNVPADQLLKIDYPAGRGAAIAQYMLIYRVVLAPIVALGGLLVMLLGAILFWWRLQYRR